jgi:RsmE family RNA methyltransferase
MSALESHHLSHRFSLYLPDLEEVKGSQAITDQTLMHRIKAVLRLGVGDQCILFDNTHHALVSIKETSTKLVRVEFLSKEPHRTLSPEIHWLLPTLKREAFEEALYSLTEMGATSIQPLFTLKTQRSWGSEKDYARAKNIMRAAAEQSKYYVMPTLYPVCDLKEWKMAQGVQGIFFDTEGVFLKDLLNQIGSQTSFIGCVGPEADLTPDEKADLKRKGFLFCALTPTVLRAKQAVTLSIGLLRSFYRS